ncbi:MAG: hypothetical protein QXS03_01435 [Candidatus Micrarchaeaceae archaeon]
MKKEIPKIFPMFLATLIWSYALELVFVAAFASASNVLFFQVVFLSTPVLLFFFLIALYIFTNNKKW